MPSKETVPKEQVSLRLTVAAMRGAERLGRLNGVGRTQIIEQAIRKYLKEHGIVLEEPEQ